MTYCDKEDEEPSLEARWSALCGTLGSLGVTSVVVTYDGYSDSGTVGDEIRVEPSTSHVPEEVLDDLVELVEEWLPGGWEINDGEFGEVTLNVAERLVGLEQNIRSGITTESSQTRLPPEA